jgi:hypothetical protein
MSLKLLRNSALAGDEEARRTVLAVMIAAIGDAEEV